MPFEWQAALEGKELHQRGEHRSGTLASSPFNVLKLLRCLIYSGGRLVSVLRGVLVEFELRLITGNLNAT